MSLNRLACTYSYVTLTLCRSGGLGGSSSMRSYHCKVARLQQSFIQRRRHLYDQMKEHLEGEGMLLPTCLFGRRGSSRSVFSGAGVLYEAAARMGKGQQTPTGRPGVSCKEVHSVWTKYAHG